MLQLKLITSLHEARSIVRAHFEDGRLVLTNTNDTVFNVDDAKFDVVASAVHYPYRAHFGDHSRTFTLEGAEFRLNGSNPCYYLVATPYAELKAELERLKSPPPEPEPTLEPTEKWVAVTSYTQLLGKDETQVRLARDFEGINGHGSVWGCEQRDLFAEGRNILTSITIPEVAREYIHATLDGAARSYGFHFRDFDVLVTEASDVPAKPTKKWVKPAKIGVTLVKGMKVKAKQKGNNPFGNVNDVEGLVGEVEEVLTNRVRVKFTFPSRTRYVAFPFDQVRVKVGV